LAGIIYQSARGTFCLSCTLVCCIIKKAMQMLRAPREKSKNGVYHIMMRRIDKKGIFFCESDNYAFLHHTEAFNELK